MRQAVLPKAYLLLYNVAQFGGWAFCLYHLLNHVDTTRSLEGTYAVAGDAVRELITCRRLHLLQLCFRACCN